jgi:hypothetical protein
LGENGLPDDYEEHEGLDFVQIPNLYAFGPNDLINGIDVYGESWVKILWEVLKKVGPKAKPKPPAPKPPVIKPKPKPKNKGGGCKPCNPTVGTPAYRYDKCPPSAPHHPCKGNHIHWYKVSQRPATANVGPCKCEWVVDKAKGTKGVECDDAGTWTGPPGVSSNGDNTNLTGGGKK